VCVSLALYRFHWSSLGRPLTPKICAGICKDYLRAPHGVYRDRGERAVQRLTQWSQAAFGAVFDSSRAARDAYVRLRDRPRRRPVRPRTGRARPPASDLLYDPAAAGANAPVHTFNRPLCRRTIYA
jgi:hypothetical protein